MNKGKVLVGMSGGVDSSVAALLLLQEGYDAAGATFRMWDGPGDETNVRDARLVCDTLGIAHHVLDFRQVFRAHVLDYFVREYDGGRTPNPCVACNRWVKWPAFLAQARELGMDKIASGHYATVLYDNSLGRYRLKKGKHDQKDQSYVLYPLTQDILAATLLPLGEYSKQEVRALAQQHGLPVSQKADSQDICFVPDRDYHGFLQKYTGRTSPAGEFVDGNGKRLGTHGGIWRYTIGQRKGLGVSLGKPMFVTAIDSVHSTVTLGEGKQLLATELIADNLQFIDYNRLEQPVSLQAKIRYSARPEQAQVIPQQDGTVRVVFAAPQRAVTKGQSVVFYDGDFVAGGGTIIG